MRTSASLRIGLVLGMLATLLTVGPAGAQAAVVSGRACDGATPADLWATTGTRSMPPAAATVNVWGYSATSGGPVSFSDSVIVATQGALCQVRLHNDLARTTGLVFDGQAMVPDLTGVVAGSDKLYSFTPSNPGTYLYEAGLVPGTQYQAAMGMVGILIVRPAVGPSTDYGTGTNTDFTDEAVVVLGEIDPALNNRADPWEFDLRNYAPKYYTINGEAYPNGTPIAIDTPLVQRTALLRYANAGLLPHSMGLLGLDQRFISSGGSLLTAPETEVARSIAPGETTDSLVTIPTTAAGLRFPLYDQSKLLNNNNAGVNQTGTGQPGRIYDLGGMMTFLQVGGSAGGAAGPTTSNIVITPVPASGAPPATINVTASVGAGTNAAELFLDAPSTPGTGVAGVISGPASNLVATWTGVPVAALATGNHDVIIHASADGGTTYGPFNSATLHIDRTGPAITGLTLTPNPTNSSTVVIGATANDTGNGGSNIVSASYSVAGGPSNQAMTVAVLTDPVSALSGSIPTAALTPGTHTVTVSATDAMGQTGTGTIDLVIDRTGPITDSVLSSPSTCTVPGCTMVFTNGKVPADSSNPSIQIRARFADVASTIKAGEAFIDTVGANGTGIPFVPSDGVFNFAQEYGYINIPLTTIMQLSQADHTLYIHGKDAAGNWGATTTFTIRVDKAAPTVSSTAATPSTTNTLATNASTFALTTTATDAGTPPSGIVAGEWFEGADPGVGLGHAMTFVNMPFGDTVENLTATIDFVALGWTTGNHTVSVRAKDGAGTWSATQSVVVNVVYPNALFSNGFESPTSSPFGWSSASGASRLSTSIAASMGAGSTRGLQAQLVCNNATCANPLTSSVVDGSPYLDREYHARFYLDPNTVTLSNHEVTIFSGHTGDTGDGTRVFWVELRRIGTQFSVRMSMLRSNAPTTVSTAWVNITDASHTIEVAWQSATGNATTHGWLWIDQAAPTQVPPGNGNATAVLAGNTSNNSLGSVRLGPSAFTGTGTVSGNLWFDGLRVDAPDGDLTVLTRPRSSEAETYGGVPASDARPSDREGIRAKGRVARFAPLAAAAALLVLATVIGTQWWASTRLPKEIVNSTAVSPQVLEEKYGVRVDLVGVVASGGLIDLRFTVTDPLKASQLFGVHVQSPSQTHGDAVMPVLVPDGARTPIHVAGAMAHHLTLREDGKYYLLYPNPAGAIQGGSPVSVVIDDVRLDGVIART